MFKSLVAATILTSGLALGAAPASAHDWGEGNNWGYSQDEEYARRPNPREWEHDGYGGPHWGRVQFEDGWGWRPHRHRHDWGDRERYDVYEGDPSY